MSSVRSPRKGASSPPPQRVRIIGGQWKRTPLPVLDAAGLRPTPDRVRESVFNWLNHRLGGDWERVRCLDLFAGSGALGFEAASRGAAHVLMVESHLSAARHLEQVCSRLGAQQVHVRRGDALAIASALIQRKERFQVIFLDPPYHQGLLEKILPLCQQLLSEGGLVYAEAEQPLDGPERPVWLEGWEVVRADKAGAVFYHLLQRNRGHEIRA